MIFFTMCVVLIPLIRSSVDHPIGASGYCITRSDTALSYWDLEGNCDYADLDQNTTLFQCYATHTQLARLSLRLKEDNRIDTRDESTYISITVVSESDKEFALNLKLN